jgi:DNA-binding CsgD family transcriptional regulator
MRPDLKKPDKIDSRDKETEAARIVKEQFSDGMWNMQIVIFSYAVTIAAVIMAFKGVRVEIIASIAVIGLSIVWIWGRLRYKRLYKRLYQNEIRHLKELNNGDNSNSLEVVNALEARKNGVLHSINSPLTPRQQEILSLIASGNSNKQVATQLNLSERTIKNQLGYVFKKLDVEDRTQAVLVSLRNGWIPPETDENYQPTVTISSGRAVDKTDNRQENNTPVSKFAHYL